MNRLIVAFILYFLVIVLPASALDKVISGSASYNTSAPTDSDIANWTSGWGASGVTGWNYVGEVNGPAGASGVYLGNSWVLTAGHVGSGTFTLSGTSYSVVPGSAQGISLSGTAADLTLFRISSAPLLPALTISGTAPAPFTGLSGDQVVMMGYGGGHGETWGLNTVTAINVSVALGGYPYVTTDFETAFGTTMRGGHSVTNNYQFIIGDSGGGDFVYDASSGTWELAGINEAIDGSNNGYMVQLSSYASQIDSIVAVPEPSSFVLLGIGLMALLWKIRSTPKRKLN